MESGERARPRVGDGGRLATMIARDSNSVPSCAPLPQLLPQELQGGLLGRRQALGLEPVDHGNLEVGDALAGVEGEKAAAVGQRE